MYTSWAHTTADLGRPVEQIMNITLVGRVAFRVFSVPPVYAAQLAVPEIKDVVFHGGFNYRVL